MRSCYIGTGSVHTTLGRGLEANIDSLSKEPPMPGLAKVDYGENQASLPFRFLHGVPVPSEQSRVRSRFESVLRSVVGSAFGAISSSGLDRTALFLGSSSFDICVSEDEYRTELSDEASVNGSAIAMRASSSQGNPADWIREQFRVRGPAFTFNTACTSSANALVAADAMVRSGRADYALVVAIEFYNAITALGFDGLQLLSPNGMRPFSRDRNGLILGESCAAVLLSSRTRDGCWELRGSHNVCDTHSMSAANPDGSSVEKVIRSAMRSADVEAEDIAAIKAHGTASLLNDEAEAAGMHRIFDSLPPIGVLKPHLGHTLGACGLTELLLFCGGVEQKRLPVVTGFQEDPTLNVILGADDRVPDEGLYLLNYFGFGGNCTSLVLQRSASGAKGGVS